MIKKWLDNDFKSIFKTEREGGNIKYKSAEESQQSTILGDGRSQRQGHWAQLPRTWEEKDTGQRSVGQWAWKRDHGAGWVRLDQERQRGGVRSPQGWARALCLTQKVTLNSALYRGDKKCFIREIWQTKGHMETSMRARCAPGLRTARPELRTGVESEMKMRISQSQGRRQRN